MGNKLPCCTHIQTENDLAKFEKKFTTPAGSILIEDYPASPSMMMKKSSLIEFVYANRASIDIATDIERSSIEITMDAKFDSENTLKYKQIARDIELISLFDEVLKCIEDQNQEKFLKVTSGKYNSEENLNFKVDVKEHLVGEKKTRYHELRQKFDMKLNPLELVHAQITMPISEKKKYDSNMVSHDLIYCYEENNTIFYFHRLTTKKILAMPGKEILTASAFRKLADGRYLEVYKSYEEPEYPITDSLDRIVMDKGGCLFEPVVDETAEMKSLIKFGSDVETESKATSSQQLWRASVYHFVDPKVNISVKLMKGFLGKYWKNVFMNMFKVVESYRNDVKGNWNEILQLYEKM